jgi:hypothetical protein
MVASYLAQAAVLQAHNEHLFVQKLLEEEASGPRAIRVPDDTSEAEKGRDA